MCESRVSSETLNVAILAMLVSASFFIVHNPHMLFADGSTALTKNQKNLTTPVSRLGSD
jgi:hypothetical protein